MEKNAKIVIGAIGILLVCCIVFNVNITGEAFFDRFRFLRFSRITPTSPVTPVTPVSTPTSTFRRPTPTTPMFVRVRKEPYCKDTDNGKNTAVKGFVNSNSFQAYDICDWNDQDSVWERYCVGTEPRSEKIACGTGKTCLDGKCIDKEAPTGCVDSDGLDQYTYGEASANSKVLKDACVAYIYNSTYNKYSWDYTLYKDVCKKDTPGTYGMMKTCFVNEAYCNTTTIVDQKLIYCSSGECRNGICIK